MERVNITIGSLSFGHAEYDLDNDVLYLHVGAPQDAEGEETREGHVIRYAPGTSRVVGLTVLGVRRCLERNGHLEVTVPSLASVRGAWRGRVRIADDFDALPKDIAEAFGTG